MTAFFRWPLGGKRRWIAMLLTAVAQQVGAAQCSISVQGINFGSYDVFGSQSVDSTGNVSVTCDTSTTYSISLSPGSGSYASRAMTNGLYQLNYNLYTDATRSVIWGDGAGGTGTVGGTWTADVNHTVYGSIPAGQNAYVGSYSDSITVTLTF